MQVDKYSKLERWLLSSRGKRMLNRLYSWGAALVILGALFKFLEWPYANYILFMSLSIEILVFFVSGFEPQESDSNVTSQENISQDTTTPSSPFPRNHSEAYAEEMRQLARSVAELKDEHQRMLRNLAELNAIYKRMLDAVTKQDKD